VTTRAFYSGLLGKTSTVIINNEPILYKDIEIDNTKKNEQVTEINNIENNIENEQVTEINNNDTEINNIENEQVTEINNIENEQVPEINNIENEQVPEINNNDTEIDNNDTEINNTENEQVKSISRSSKKRKKYRTRMLRKRLAKVEGGFLKEPRGAHKFKNGRNSLVSGDMNEAIKACMPDAIYIGVYALKQQDNTTPLLSKDELRSKLPFDGSAPNILDAKNFLNGKNFNLKALNECRMNPLAVLKKIFGVYILKVVAAYHDDRGDDHHFMTYDGYAGLLMDNYRGNKLIQREESDLKSTQTALKCFEPFFMNTKSIKLTHVFELTYNGNLV
jgi:hypothetical protein